MRYHSPPISSELEGVPNTTRPFFRKGGEDVNEDTFFPSYHAPFNTETESKTELASQINDDQNQEDHLSPMREEVFRLFKILNEKGTYKAMNTAEGSEDKDWLTITGQTQKTWNTRKKDEEPWRLWREYKDNKKAYESYLKTVEMYNKGIIKKKPKEMKEPKEVLRQEGLELNNETTCILTASNILSKAAQKLNLKHDTLQLMSPKKIAESPAWTWAEPGMTKRPQPGDIFVFVALGEKITSAQTAMSRAQSITPKDIERLEKARNDAQKIFNAGMAKNDAQLDILRRAEDKLITDAEKPSKLSVIQAKEMVKAYKGALKIWAKNLKEANDRYEKAVNGIKMAEQQLKEARESGFHKDYFFFSHVGMFQSITKPLGVNPDPEKELWKTFDGGRTFFAKADNSGDKLVEKQGAKDTDRVYDPATNETWMNTAKPGDVATQDGLRRWLLGWYNLDKLVH